MIPRRDGESVDKGRRISLDKQTKDENKLVSKWLIEYPRRKAAYESLREAFAYPERSGAHANAGTTRYQKRNLQSTDHTARIGILLAEGKIVPEEDLDPNEVRWLELIEEMERRMPLKARILLKLRREVAHKEGLIKKGKYRGRPAWIPAVQHRYAEEIARLTGKRIEDVWVENPNTFSNWWRRVVDYVARQAAKRGLLD